MDKHKKFTAYALWAICSWTNRPYPLTICSLETTALRLRKALSTPARVEECEVYESGHLYAGIPLLYGPITLTAPSLEDEKQERKIKEMQIVLKKARDLGLTESEIRTLKES